jgi:CDP-glucose 4,6-dehydratase
MFQNIYEGKKVIITGHTGFKGAWLSIWLKLLKAEVYGISDKIPTHPSLFEVSSLEKEVNSTMEDIRHADRIKTLFRNIAPDFVFHLAAQPIVKTSYENPVDTFLTNIIGSANILEALRELTNPCAAVMITSDKCYDNVEWVWGYKETDALGGKDPYSASKGAAELIIKTYYHSYFKNSGHIKIASVRAGNVIGGGDWAESRIVPDCYRAWSANKKVIIRSPNSIRPWQHVLEPLSGYLKTGQELASPSGKNIHGEAFNFGPPAEQNHTVLNLINNLAESWKPGHSAMLQIERSDFHEAGLLKLNCDKALFWLDWKANLNFNETAKFTSEWYTNYYLDKQADMGEFTRKQVLDYVSLARERQILWAMK